MRRVVITGLGTVNALGPDVRTSWPRMLAGENGVRLIKNFPTEDLPVRFAASVDWNPEEFFAGPEFRKLDPFTMFALKATAEALLDAGLDPAKESEEAREAYGAIVGTGIGGITGIVEQHTEMLERGSRRVSPHFIPKIMANAVSGQVAIRHGLLGTAFTTSSACASSGHAMAMAFQAIRTGEIDVAVTGGAESATTRLSVSGFANMRALSTRNDAPELACRPFDKNRDGFVMGEGAGILIFEEYERAKKRGARFYAEVKGYGSTDDAYHITAPKEDGAGPARAFRLAIKMAGIDPETVHYVNAHGTSTPYNDAIETRALKRFFGEHARKLAVSSTKSMIGHLLGASSAVELVATALSVHQGRVHPTRNLEVPDPECDLDYVPGAARELSIQNALSNSLGFGGHNISICIGRPG
ncbi:MAG: beta-ketoacyl-[acyl-carrier-protein] synthase II [Planctomycetes bacterium]|nr:beta-ketoacyl-[acyl-carrier-protein] synthase II [Planctomycetota bacterium]